MTQPQWIEWLRVTLRVDNDLGEELGCEFGAHKEMPVLTKLGLRELQPMAQLSTEDSAHQMPPYTLLINY
jgi:hypothetical protein